MREEAEGEGEGEDEDADDSMLSPCYSLAV